MRRLNFLECQDIAGGTTYLNQTDGSIFIAVDSDDNFTYISNALSFTLCSEGIYSFNMQGFVSVSMPDLDTNGEIAYSIGHITILGKKFANKTYYVIQ